MTIDELLDTEGYTEECDGCAYYRFWYEAHIPGFPGEPLSECIAENDGDCPRLKNESHK